MYLLTKPDGELKSRHIYSVNTNTDIVQQPSAWKRTLVYGALGRRAFSDDKEPDALESCEDSVFDPYPCSDLEEIVALAYLPGLAVFSLTALWLDPSRSLAYAYIWVTAIVLWPLSLFLILLLVVLPLCWLLIRCSHALCSLIAKRVCPVELGYYQVRKQVRLQ
jgi:hypothetical protein